MVRKLDLTMLDQFSPKPSKSVGVSASADEKAIKKPRRGEEMPEDTSWPSREPITHGSFTIRAPLDVIQRFKSMCKDDRRTYADMLNILMDSHESR